MTSGTAMMGHRTPKHTAAEYDLLFARRWYCYLQQPGAAAKIKRGMRRRERRAGKREARDN